LNPRPVQRPILTVHPSVTTASRATGALNELEAYPLVKRYVCAEAWLQRGLITLVSLISLIKFNTILRRLLTHLIDLLRIASLESRLKAFPIPEESHLDAWAYIWFPGNDCTYKPEAHIRVPIIDLELHHTPPRRVILWANYYSKLIYNMPDRNQAIPSSSVPPIETLLDAYLNSTRIQFPVASPFSRLSKAFRDFAESYCNRSATLPLVSIDCSRIDGWSLLSSY